LYISVLNCTLLMMFNYSIYCLFYHIISANFVSCQRIISWFQGLRNQNNPTDINIWFKVSVLLLIFYYVVCLSKKLYYSTALIQWEYQFWFMLRSHAVPSVVKLILNKKMHDISHYLHWSLLSTYDDSNGATRMVVRSLTW